MSYVALTQSLPQCDHTKSTNYGSSFEMSMAAMVLLRCCNKKIDAVVSINDTHYAPWDDLVLKYHDKIICFQLKHTGSVKKNKLKKCLAKQGEILLKQQQYENAGALTFVYLTTATATEARLHLPRLATVPDVCNLFLTNSHVYHDSITDTYFCMNQHDVAQAHYDIYDALQEFVGEDYATKDFMLTLQVNFKEYVRNRFYRLIKRDSPLTTEEVRQHLGYALLSQFLIPYAYPANTHAICKQLKEKLKKMRIIVLNHRSKSSIKENIWKYLIKLPRGKHHLGNEWSFGEELHMPLFSPKRKTDRRILRALEMLDYKCKVVIFRPRLFKTDLGLTILATLATAGTMKFEHNDGDEIFKYVEVRPGSLAKVESLHDDLFCKLARDFNAGDRYICEAHDELSYVNEEITIDRVRMTPLTAVIKSAGVDVNVVEDLINFGSGLNARDSEGFTALYFALESNRSDIVDLLLRRGAKPDPVDKLGITPLCVACSEGKTEMIDLLLKHGSNRYKADAFGTTPIFKAYQAKHYQILNLLMRGNKNPTAANAKGCHILHQAALDGDVECLKCVLKSFPDLNVFLTGNAAGKNPVEIARENNHREFVDIYETNLKKVEVSNAAR